MKKRRRRRLRRRWILLPSVLILILIIVLLIRSCSAAESGDSAVQGGPAGEESVKEGSLGDNTSDSSGEAVTDPAAVQTESVQSGLKQDDGVSATATDPAAVQTESAQSGLKQDDGGIATVTDLNSAQTESPTPSQTELEKGKEYLESLDGRNPDEVKKEIDEEKAAYEAKKEERAYALKRDEYLKTLEGDALWSSFDDFVFLGDSRVVGFSLYGFLSSDRVFAETGDTINAISGSMDRIRSLQPKSIFISYGINDISCGLWPTADEYAKDFGRQLDELKKELPDADIYVNSILPATSEAIEYAPVWGGLPEYSEAVRKVCRKKKVSFIDNSNLFEEHEDLYEGDGVHVKPDFYRFWAENQILGVFDKSNGRLTFSADN